MDYLQASPLGTAVGYAYRIAAVLLVIAAYIFVRWSRTHSGRPWSALAVAAGALGILHPTMWISILTAANIPCYELPWFGRGDNEMRSFAYSVMVLGLAIVATVRIARSKGQLRGVLFCIVGLYHRWLSVRLLDLVILYVRHRLPLRRCGMCELDPRVVSQRSRSRTFPEFGLPSLIKNCTFLVMAREIDEQLFAFKDEPGSILVRTLGALL